MTSSITLVLCLLFVISTPYRVVQAFLQPCGCDAKSNHQRSKMLLFRREGEHGIIPRRAIIRMAMTLTSTSSSTSTVSLVEGSTTSRITANNRPLQCTKGRTTATRCSMSPNNQSGYTHSYTPSTQECESSIPPTRRNFLQHITIPMLPILIMSLALFQSPMNAHAATIDTTSTTKVADTILLRGTVTLQPGITLPPSSSPSTPESNSNNNSALYITARPNTADNVPRAILDGSRGKPPPVLTARLENSYSFPLDFQLTPLDLTIEGRGATATTGDTDASSTKEEVEYWWKDLDLIVSARWDTDGIAATRDPTDLVGRGLAPSKARRSASGGGVIVPLQGRGFTGKLVTGKSNKT